MLELLQDLFDANAPDDAALAVRVRAGIQDEPITVLRVATMIAHSGRWPAAGVSRACQEEQLLLASARPEAVRLELERCLLGRDIDLALQWLHDVGAMALLLPELEATVDFSQEAGRAHKDVWEHTKQVVKQAVPRPAIRWAALLHDIGKVPTRTFTRDGVHFHGHAEVGARMFDKVARRLPFERPLRDQIRFLILHHLRSSQYSEAWTDSAVRRFAREMGEHLDDLLDLSRADITSKRPGRRKALLQQIHALAERIGRIHELDARLPPLPTGLGNSIMTRFGLPPSKRIGDLKRALEEAVERGELEERREDDYYLGWLEKSGLLG